MFKCRKLYHFFVLLNIQGSLVHEVLLLVRVRVQYSRLRKRLRGRPLLARLLGGERHRDLQAVGPAATPRRIRVYFLKTKTHSRLEETFIVSDPSSEICWNSPENLPWLSSDCWSHCHQTRCMYPPLMSPQTPLVSVPSSSSVSGCSSKNTDAIFSCRWCCTLTPPQLLKNSKTLIVTVFAKPPSEPKLSQLSSEEEEDEVSMGTSGELRKLLRLILVDGDWAASFCRWQQVR